MYLDDDGVKIAGIFTFGQPKVTNVAGAIAYGHLPVLRVIYQNDVVSLYPQPKRGSRSVRSHWSRHQPAFLRTYYFHATKEQALSFSPGSLERYFAQISVPDHKMKYYLESLQAKLEKPVQVTFADRNKYIFRHRGHSVPGQRGNGFL